MDWENIFRESAFYHIGLIEKCAPGIDYKNKNILDAGCWWGWFMRYAREKGGIVYGFDYDMNKLRDAVDFIGSRGLCLADAQHIPFRENTFDMVFSWHVVEHLSDPHLMLRNIHRLLKKQGELIIAVPNDLNLSTLPYRPLRFLLNKEGNMLKEINQYRRLKSIAYSDDSHCREYTLKALYQTLKGHSFDIINALSYGCELPYPLKGRLSRKQSLFIHKVLGPLTLPVFRAGHIVYARKSKD